MQDRSQTAESHDALEVSLAGIGLINSPRLNKGTAFPDHERDLFGLHGLLPPHVGTLDEQVERRLRALNDEPTPFTKYSFLRDLQDINETLFYALLVRNIERCCRWSTRPRWARAASASAKSGESREACF